MLYLGYTGSTSVTVTLYEKCSNQLNPYFTWRINDKDSNVETIFTADDYSSSPYYYNTFTISVASPEGLTSGIIDINAGQYSYEIYEMSNPYDLDLNNAIGIVEKGLITINATYSQIQSYTSSSSTTNVYRNQNRV